MVIFSPLQLTQHLRTAGIPLKDNCEVPDVIFFIPPSLMNDSRLYVQHVIKMKAPLSSPSSSHALIDKARLRSFRQMSFLTVWA